MTNGPNPTNAFRKRLVPFLLLCVLGDEAGIGGIRCVARPSLLRLIRHVEEVERRLRL